MRRTAKEIEKAIRKALGKSLAFDDITLGDCLEDEDGNYFEFEFQVDDRIFQDTEKELSRKIEKVLGIKENDTSGVSSVRDDAFPSGHAAYTVTFEELDPEEELG